MQQHNLRFKPASNFVLLIVPSRYFCGGSFCFMSWCLKFFVLLAPYVCFHTKAQISCAVTAQLISVFVLAIQIPLLLKSKISSFKPSSEAVAWFVSDLVGNQDYWFSHAKAQ